MWTHGFILAGGRVRDLAEWTKVLFLIESNMSCMSGSSADTIVSTDAHALHACDECAKRKRKVHGINTTQIKGSN